MQILSAEVRVDDDNSLPRDNNVSYSIDCVIDTTLLSTDSRLTPRPPSTRHFPRAAPRRYDATSATLQSTSWNLFVIATSPVVLVTPPHFMNKLDKEALSASSVNDTHIPALSAIVRLRIYLLHCKQFMFNVK